MLRRYLTTTTTTTDIAIIGAGLVGLSTARSILQNNPHLNITILEKESKPAQHQSSHNSGVIHAGIYYKPGSKRAELCVQGAAQMYQYCQTNNIPYSKNGKLIVATNQEEIPRLKNLYQTGMTNQVEGLEIIDTQQIKEIEPLLCNGNAPLAIWSPNTGIVDYELVAQHIAKEIQNQKAEIKTNFEVVQTTINNDDNMNGGITLQAKDGRELICKRLITCAGLQSDRVATQGDAGGQDQPSIIPFVGKWLTLKEEYGSMINTNVYPVPDPKYPWLGVHFTPTMTKNEILLGPNAVLVRKFSFFERNVETKFDRSLIIVL